MNGTSGGIVEQVRNSQLLRLCCITLLAGLLLIPVSMIDGVISERQNRREEAVREVTSIWGNRQVVPGPKLVIPYRRTVTEPDRDGLLKSRVETGYATFLPETLKVNGVLHCETRYRGIYKIPVYAADLTLSGVFTPPDFSSLGIADVDILWDRAYLSLQVTDARAITNRAALRWNGRELLFLPGAGEFSSKEAGIQVPLRGQLSAERFEFSARLNLNGSESLFFAPLGKDTLVEISSNWLSPGFQGNWLPVDRKISPQGFKATWRIPYLGRNYPQQWKDREGFDEAITASCFGIKLIPSLDQYAMAKRSTKYGILFILLTFITLWLFEIVARVRIHPIQYVLVGSGLSLFFLLELSLAEHIGFSAAYLCATLLICSLIYGYCRFILGGMRRSAILGTVVVLLYGYLYVLLMNQDYALLIGSLCLFLVLGSIMYITRNIDWYGPHKSARSAGDRPD